MNIFLQANTPVGYTDLYWISGVVFVVLISWFYLLKFGRQRKTREEMRRDTRSHIVNDSSYNIRHTGVDEHRTAATTAKEAKETIEQLKETDQIPSRDEFHRLRNATRDTE